MIEYSPYDPEIQHNPYPCWKRLRDEAPVYHNEEIGFWALSRWDDVLSAHLDTSRFLSGHGVTIEGFDPPGAMLINKDDPDQHYYLLQHGRITHGLQFTDPEESRKPVSYYGDQSGIALAVHPISVQSAAARLLQQGALLLVGLSVGLNGNGTAKYDDLTYQTREADVFVGGDACTGPKFAIDAIAQGKQAAISIGRFIRGEDMSVGREKEWQAVRAAVVKADAALGNLSEVTEPLAKRSGSIAAHCRSSSQNSPAMLQAPEVSSLNHDEFPTSMADRVLSLELLVPAVLHLGSSLPHQPSVARRAAW